MTWSTSGGPEGEVVSWVKVVKAYKGKQDSSPFVTYTYTGLVALSNLRHSSFSGEAAGVVARINIWSISQCVFACFADVFASDPMALCKR